MVSHLDDFRRKQQINIPRCFFNVNERFFTSLCRDIAEEMLGISMPGTFFIRESTSNPGAFALSIRIPRSVKDSGIANILIEHQANGDFKIPVCSVCNYRHSNYSLNFLLVFFSSIHSYLDLFNFLVTC